MPASCKGLVQRRTASLGLAPRIRHTCSKAPPLVSTRSKQPMPTMAGATCSSWSTRGWYLPVDCHMSRYTRLSFISLFCMVVYVLSLCPKKHYPNVSIIGDIAKIQIFSHFAKTFFLNRPKCLLGFPTVRLVRRIVAQKKQGRRLGQPLLAEGEGFEPPDLLQSAVFKTAAIDHSAIPPRSDSVRKAYLPTTVLGCKNTYFFQTLQIIFSSHVVSSPVWLPMPLPNPSSRQSGWPLCR